MAIQATVLACHTIRSRVRAQDGSMLRLGEHPPLRNGPVRDRDQNGRYACGSKRQVASALSIRKIGK